jgi:hypothetical protein
MQPSPSEQRSQQGRPQTSRHLLSFVVVVVVAVCFAVGFRSLVGFKKTRTAGYKLPKSLAFAASGAKEAQTEKIRKR